MDFEQGLVAYAVISSTRKEEVEERGRGRGKISKGQLQLSVSLSQLKRFCLQKKRGGKEEKTTTAGSVITDPSSPVLSIAGL